jgi:hypothetical protein
MNIWHIENRNGKSLFLWRTGKNAFRVVKDGLYNPLLINGNYSLISDKYVNILSQLSNQVSIQNVSIFDYQLKTENTQYVELVIVNSITPDSINIENSSGFKIWGFNGNIFVSGDLKNELIKVDDTKELVFSLGFSQFG